MENAESCRTRCRALLGRGRIEIRSVEIVLAGDPDKGEECVPARVGQGRSHAARRRRFCDRAYWPLRGDPFAGSVGQHGGQSHQARFAINRGGLDSRDLVSAQTLANEIEAARQGGVTERAVALAWEGGVNGGGQRFLRIGEFGLGFGQCPRDSADRVTRPLHEAPPYR